jgi:uncharacterized delta-60 repeat protein
LSILVLPVLLLAGSVSLDTSFNGTGYRVYFFNPDGSVGRSVAIGADGKIVLGGSTLLAAQLGSFAAMRANTDGSPDTGFDSDGFAVRTLGTLDRGDTTLIQPDGKVLLAGERFSATSNNDLVVLRFNADGTPDATFDGDGVAELVRPGVTDEHLYDMKLLPDGKIVLVGTTDQSTATGQNAPTDIFVTRLNANGSVDTTLAGGFLTIRFDGVSEAANSVLVQPDGKMVLGGFVFAGVSNDYLLMRITPTGMLDTTFGDGGTGFTITPVTTGSDAIVSMAFQSDGKILAGGSGRVVRYTASGVLDTSFASSGIANPNQSVNQIIVTDGDKFLVGGRVSGTALAVSRFNANGTPDLGFNGTGVVNAFVPGSSCDVSSIALQADKRIVLGGSCSNGPTNFFLMRLRETVAKAPFDFDGDGKTDVSIFRPSVGQWWYQKSGDSQVAALQFGVSTDKTVPADFTGDGKTDIALFRPSTGFWYILRSEDFSYYAVPFGLSGDVPVPADYDGDLKADTAVFRPSNSTWYISPSGGGAARFEQFGTAGDVPVPADFDGDSKTDLAIFRPSVGQWWISRSASSSVTAFQFGTATDKLVQGDYTGDGKADAAFWRPSTGEWFIARSGTSTFYSVPFGSNGDIPTPGDYDGDGRFDTAVFRPSQSTWYIDRSTAGVAIQQFGSPGDAPLPASFVP